MGSLIKRESFKKLCYLQWENTTCLIFLDSGLSCRKIGAQRFFVLCCSVFCLDEMWNTKRNLCSVPSASRSCHCRNNGLCSTTCIENVKCKQRRALRSVPPFYTVSMKKEGKGGEAYGTRTSSDGWRQHQAKPLLLESHGYFYTKIRDFWDIILCSTINRHKISGRTCYFSKLKEERILAQTFQSTYE